MLIDIWGFPNISESFRKKQKFTKSIFFSGFILKGTEEHCLIARFCYEIITNFSTIESKTPYILIPFPGELKTKTIKKIT